MLGPSGAGKTTLLNLLAGYRTSNMVRIKTRERCAVLAVQEGKVRVNGAERRPDSCRALSAYIMQQDSLSPVTSYRPDNENY